MNAKRTFSGAFLGLMLLAAGDCVFAGNALEQLNGGSPNFDGAASYKGTVHLPAALSTSSVTAGKTDVSHSPDAKATAVPTANPSPQDVSGKSPGDKATADHSAHLVPPPPDTQPAPPGGGPNPVTQILKQVKTPLFAAGVGAYIGFAIAATVAGALTGGLLFLGLFLLANL